MVNLYRDSDPLSGKILDTKLRDSANMPVCMVVITKILRFLPFFPIVFGVAVINTTILQEFTFPSDDLKVTGDEKIDIPNSVFVSGEYWMQLRT